MQILDTSAIGSGKGVSLSLTAFFTPPDGIANDRIMLCKYLIVNMCIRI